MGLHFHMTVCRLQATCPGQRVAEWIRLHTRAGTAEHSLCSGLLSSSWESAPARNMPLSAVTEGLCSSSPLAFPNKVGAEYQERGAVFLVLKCLFNYTVIITPKKISNSCFILPNTSSCFDFSSYVKKMFFYTWAYFELGSTTWATHYVCLCLLNGSIWNSISFCSTQPDTPLFLMPLTC